MISAITCREGLSMVYERHFRERREFTHRDNREGDETDRLCEIDVSVQG